MLSLSRPQFIQAFGYQSWLRVVVCNGSWRDLGSRFIQALGYLLVVVYGGQFGFVRLISITAYTTAHVYTWSYAHFGMSLFVRLS